MLERNHLTVLTLSIRPRAQPEDDMGTCPLLRNGLARLHFRGR